MIYDNPGQRVQDMEKYVLENKREYRMANVETVTNGRPYVRFYGEESASKKAYKYLSSYSPFAGDKVLLARVGVSYVIMGKVI